MMFDVGDMTLTLEILQLLCSAYRCIGATVARLGMGTTSWEGWVTRCAWACHLVPMTFDLGDMTLTLEIFWQLLYPTYLYYIGQFGCGLPMKGSCERACHLSTVVVTLEL